MREKRLPNALAGVQWYLGMARALVRNRPGTTSLIIATSLIARVSQTVAFVLPLKVIILLGTPRVPAYIPDAMADLGRSPLIAALAGIALCFYLIHLVLGRFSEKRIQEQAEYLHESAGKLAAIPNQDQSARQAYAKCIASITGISFVALAGFGVGLLYPTLLLVLLSFFAAAGGTYLLAGRLGVPLTPAGFLDVAASLGFLSAFSFIVLDFLLKLAPPPLIFALIGFVLSRQLLTSASSALKQISSLWLQRSRIEALFFDGQFLRTGEGDREQRYWQNLAPRNRDQWIPPIVEHALDTTVTGIETRWIPSGVRGIVTLEVVAAVSGSTGSRPRILLKVFQARRDTLAQREAAVLTEGDVANLCPPWIHQGALQDGPLHAFLISDAEPAGESGRSHAVKSFRQRLMAHPLPSHFIHKYARTHPFIWERVHGGMLERLRVAATDAEQEVLTHLQELLAEIHALIRALPLQLVIPSLSAHHLFGFENGIRTANWTDWRIEPLGSHWPVRRQDDVHDLITSVDQTRAERPDVKRVPMESALMSAYLSAFEKAYDAQDFRLAIDMARAMLTEHTRSSRPDLHQVGGQLP